MKSFYLSLMRHQHVADITNRCLRHPPMMEDLEQIEFFEFDEVKV
jgi:hypothetical protein